MGPARVWLKNENIPGLAMARSIGDLVAQQAGVISDPGFKNISIFTGKTHIIFFRIHAIRAWR